MAPRAQIRGVGEAGGGGVGHGRCHAAPGPSPRSTTAGWRGRGSGGRGSLRCGALAAAVLAAALVPSSSIAGGEAVCHVQPQLLDSATAPGPLVVRIELPGGGVPDPGVFVSSVGGTPLPGPGVDAEGIDENVASREDARSAAPARNRVREQVVRFDRPCDGDPATRDDGDASDVLAMLLDRPDGAAAEICVSGTVAGEPFTCCDRVTVRNRGLRDLPGGFPFAGDDR